MQQESLLSGHALLGYQQGSSTQYQCSTDDVEHGSTNATGLGQSGQRCVLHDKCIAGGILITFCSRIAYRSLGFHQCVGLIVFQQLDGGSAGYDIDDLGSSIIGTGGTVVINNAVTIAVNCDHTYFGISVTVHFIQLELSALQNGSFTLNDLLNGVFSLRILFLVALVAFALEFCFVGQTFCCCRLSDSGSVSDGDLLISLERRDTYMNQ